MTTTLTVQIARVRSGFDDFELPSYQTPGSAGMDIKAAIEATQIIGPGQHALIPTGFAVAIPQGFEGQVRPRSGLAVKHGLTVLNAPGTIDSDYRGEIQVALINHGREPFALKRGDRIAQLVVAPVLRVKWEERARLGDTGRSTGGFGHTGK